MYADHAPTTLSLSRKRFLCHLPPAPLPSPSVVTHELLHTSLISYVDLAGSERLAKTGSTGARFVEGTNINISLLMLGTVVSK